MTDRSEQPGLAAALAAAQGELHNVGKDAKGNFGKYATLPALIDAVRPVLATHGLSWVCLPSVGENGQPTLRYQLLHTSGEVLAGEMALMLDKQNAQGQGSALTYARRYALSAVLNIGSDDDDDGQKASTTVKRQEPAVVVAAHVKELKAAAKGLTVAQIKAAFEVIGLEPPSPFPKELAVVFANVPPANAAALAAALQADVPWEGGDK